jgi:IS30 family transposase
MNTQYTQLTLQEREKIFVLRARGKTATEIANVLRRHKATISRELRRNRAPTYNRYSAHSAHKRSTERNKRRGRKPKLADRALRRHVVKKLLKEQWSPEIIAYRLSSDIPGAQISHETIYRFVYAPNNPKRRELIHALTRQHRKRKRRGYSRKHCKAHIPSRVSIKERSAVVLKRSRFGDWEADTMVSRKSLAAVAVLLERRSRYAKLAKLKRKSAAWMRSAINRRLGRLPGHMRQTITYDNGSENTEHLLVNERLGTESYFCEPFHSYEKGSVEQVVGLVRRYLPKGCDLSHVSVRQLRMIEKKINNRPRKCLQYLTPAETYKNGVALKN